MRGRNRSRSSRAGSRRDNPRWNVCEECGEKLRLLRWDRSVEGWIWCRKCGLVSNDWGTKGMGVGTFMKWVRERWSELSVGELRQVGRSMERGGDRKALRTVMIILDEKRSGRSLDV